MVAPTNYSQYLGTNHGKEHDVYTTQRRQKETLCRSTVREEWNQVQASRQSKRQPADTGKKILKSSIDTTDMRIEIRTLKGLQDGKVLTEADNKEDVKLLDTRFETNAAIDWKPVSRKEEIRD